MSTRCLPQKLQGQNQRSIPMPSFKGIKILGSKSFSSSFSQLRPKKELRYLNIGFKIFLILIRKVQRCPPQMPRGLNSFLILSRKVHKCSLFLFKGIKTMSYATHFSSSSTLFNFASSHRSSPSNIFQLFSISPSHSQVNLCFSEKN